MDEAEWLACADPEPMLEFLRGRASDRKLRLFACACCRLVWPLLKEERSRQAVEVAERYADGMASGQERSSAERDAFFFEDYLLDLGTAEEAERLEPADPSAFAAAEAAVHALCSDAYDGARFSARRARDAVLHPGARGTGWDAACDLLRDICNPFGPTTLDPAWLTPVVVSLAQAAYNERDLPSGHLDPARLAVLADALEEAGCQDPDIVGHCRSGWEHVRGCWVVDAVLGRE